MVRIKVDDDDLLQIIDKEGIVHDGDPKKVLKSVLASLVDKRLPLVVTGRKSKSKPKLNLKIIIKN